MKVGGWIAGTAGSAMTDRTARELAAHGGRAIGCHGHEVTATQRTVAEQSACQGGARCRRRVVVDQLATLKADRTLNC